MEKYDKLKNLTILYVEDDCDTQQLTRIILDDYVKKVILAKNGLEALRLFKTHNIDLILTDILMPRLNGIDLVRQIRNGDNNPTCPVIITTAHTEVPYLIDAISLKIDGYILKPVDVNEMLTSIQRAALPSIQAREIELQNLLIKAISVFIGGKKIEIIKFLIENCDQDGIYRGSYEDIIASVNVSKPTIVKTFKQLIDVGLLIKIKNKVYKIHPHVNVIDE